VFLHENVVYKRTSAYTKPLQTTSKRSKGSFGLRTNVLTTPHPYTPYALTMRVLTLLCAVACTLVSRTMAATTVELLAGDSRFSTLVSLVTKAGLVDTLNQGTTVVFLESLLKKGDTSLRSINNIYKKSVKLSELAVGMDSSTIV